MKNFIQTRTGEDGLIYSIVGTLLFGMALFCVGFLFSFETDNKVELVPGLNKTSISAILNDNYKLASANGDITNLFTLMGTLTHGTKEYQMCALSVSGFAFIMVSVVMFVSVFVVGIFVEYIGPRLKSKKGA